MSPTECGLSECDRKASTMRGGGALAHLELHSAHLFLKTPTSRLHLELYSKEIFGIREQQQQQQQ